MEEEILEYARQRKAQRKAMSRLFSPLGWSLLIYLLIMNLCVYLVMIVDMALRIAGGASMDDPGVAAALAGNGTGYLLTIVIGLFLLRLWKGPEFCEETLWTQGRPMRPGDFMGLLALFLGGQLVFQLVTVVLELIMNLFGLSLMSSVESAQISTDSITMFLYVCIGAPIAEEILFRGLVLRSLEPYGKRLAIFLSAFAFAIFHGNLVQTPYAFVVGLILGYVAMEHNIVWAMVLHMINNLLLADTLGRLTEPLPDILANLIPGLIIWACGIAGAILLLVYRDDVAQYRRKDPISWKYVGAFLRTPGVIIMMILLALSAVSPLILQVIENFR